MCRTQADCGCGTCYRNRCVVRSRLTRSRCGASASCVPLGHTLACKAAMKTSARALVAAAAAAPPMPTALLPASARPSAATRLKMLKKLRADLAAATAARDAGVSAAEEEAEMAIAEADAEIDEVKEKEAAILAALGDDNDDADKAATASSRQALNVGERTNADSQTLEELEEERKAAEASRKAAVRELHARTLQLRRDVRVTAMSGFADMNGLNRQQFLRGEAVLERAEDAAAADAEEAAEAAEAAAAAADAAADAMAGTVDEKGA